MVKLTVACLVEGLVCGSMGKKLVDLDILHLITDVNAFNKIGWGGGGYHCLAHHITEFKQWTPVKHVY